MPPRVRRAISHERSVPAKGPFFSALFCTYLHYLSLVAVAASIFLVVARPDMFSSLVLATSVVFCGLTWLVALLKRRGLRCPLCKGTPFLASGALTHSKATRLFPFNHATTAVLSCLFTHRFRCMYCGTRYDLLRDNRASQHDGDDAET